MKKAKVEVVLFSVSCPHCGDEYQEAESGSLNWDINSGDDTDPRPRRCGCCQKEFQLPRIVKGRIHNG